MRVGNGVEYGLAAAVWTRDIGKAHRIAKSLRAGMVYVNCYDADDITVPFGGFKQSGTGPRQVAARVRQVHRTQDHVDRPFAMSGYSNVTFDEIEIGATASAERVVGQTEIEALLLVSGDVVPFHVVEGACRRAQRPVRRGGGGGSHHLGHARAQAARPRHAHRLAATGIQRRHPRGRPRPRDRDGPREGDRESSRAVRLHGRLRRARPCFAARSSSRRPTARRPSPSCRVRSS